MKLRYLVALLGVLLGLASIRHGQAALAQTDNETANVTAGFKNVTLQLNSEYDNPLGYRTPTLLVMLEGQYDGEVPAQVSFLVPVDAGMYSAGSIDAQGVYTGGPPDRKASSIQGWDEISYQLETDTFRVEYYDPNIIPVSGLPDRTISYDFRTITPIGGLRAVVQQPLRSANFTVTAQGAGGPLTPTVETDFEGFPVYSYFLTDVTPGKPQHFDIAYTKPDTDPSIPETEPAVTEGASSNTGVIIGVALGVIVVGGFLVWFVKSRQSGYVPAHASRAERRRRARRGERAGGRFCTQCGEQISASDKFCPYCGAKT